MAIRYGFRRFRDDDGDDVDVDVDVDEFLQLLADDVMEHGDLEAAMDRLLQEGFTTAEGERVEGLRELLERTRQRRQELERQGDPDGELQKYRERLDEIEATEASAGEELMAEAKESGDERRIEVTRDLVDQRAMQRDLMGDRLGERLREFQDYEFISSRAREEYEQLVAELNSDLLATYFEQSKEMFSNPDSAELERVRNMMDALSTMIEQDRRGEEHRPLL